MGCGMVLTYALSVVGIHCQLCLVSHSNCSGYDLTHMSDASACDLHGLSHFKSTVFGADHTKVTLLSAHGSIERSHIGDQCTGLTYL